MIVLGLVSVYLYIFSFLCNFGYTELVLELERQIYMKQCIFRQWWIKKDEARLYVSISALILLGNRKPCAINLHLKVLFKL